MIGVVEQTPGSVENLWQDICPYLPSHTLAGGVSSAARVAWTFKTEDFWGVQSAFLTLFCAMCGIIPSAGEKPVVRRSWLRDNLIHPGVIHSSRFSYVDMMAERSIKLAPALADGSVSCVLDRA
jgi:hypothetical protein